MSETATRPVTLLPILRLPSVILPGTLVTISLDHDDARAAVESAGRGDGRLVLLADDGDVGMVGAALTGVDFENSCPTLCLDDCCLLAVGERGGVGDSGDDADVAVIGK